MRIFLCIDDTDNLDSIGTGEMLQNMVADMVARGWCTEGFVTRHQLFIHESIAYTSHNSSMCTDLKVKRELLPELIEFCGNYLQDNAAEGSDPGLCVVCYEELASPEPIMAYGERAKHEVLTKQDAYDFAAANEGVVFLSEHGGTGIGVIGALAGCGLRLSGSDGKIKGKIKPADPNKVQKIGEFLTEYGISGACDRDYNYLPLDEPVVCGEDIKIYMHQGSSVIILTPDEQERARWRPMTRDEAKACGIGL